MNTGRATTRAYTCPPDRMPPRILSPLYLSPRQGSPTIRRISLPRPCIVGPLWLPVRAHHRLSSPYLKGIGRPQGIAIPVPRTGCYISAVKSTLTNH